jgi:prevent-host-death family protein
MRETVVGIYEAKTHLSKLVRRVASGDEEVVIASAGTPLVRMVRYATPSTPRAPGLLKGKVAVHPGFDDLPAGFEPHVR